jgi:hyperosmotically inducible periplasmic protein
MKKNLAKALLATAASVFALSAMAQASDTSANSTPSDSGAMASSSTHADRSTSRTIADKTISTKVNAKFLADSDIKSRNLKVRTYKGVVHLSGFTATQDQADHAVDVAKGVDGVTDVKSTIKVKADQ